MARPSSPPSAPVSAGELTPPALAAAASSSSRASFPVGVFLLTLCAFPVCELLNRSHAMEDARLVFLAGVVFCLSLVPVAYLGVVRGVPAGRDVYFYVFTVFGFTAIVDFVLALTIDGHVDAMAFYCKEGEVYLTTAHGLWINVWDGTFHYACYLMLTALLLRPSHSYSDSSVFRTVGLVWAGSILNSMIVLFAGSAIGLHAPEIKPSYLLNIPYALFPAVFLYRVMQARPTSEAATGQSVVTSRKPLSAWLLDVPLLGLLFLSCSLCIFRALVVLRSQLPLARVYGEQYETHLTDSAAYPLVQMLTYAYFLVPYLAYAGVCTWRGVGSTDQQGRLTDWTKVALGALLQGTFSYTLAALHEGAAYPSKQHQYQTTDPAAIRWFIGVNGLLLATPIAMLMRAQCARNISETDTLQKKAQ